ncbi:MAG: hypothetical protein PF517_05945 [Salinivirgaceae bacterium]|jgi:hypothetical protein|nr:hypothetical protein [Salinivirgaceae bacterium]
MKYNLNKLEWQQFEQLAFNCLQEAISQSIIFIEGGNDKGRDFVYEGITNFFDEDNNSKKYLFQAKHKSDDKYRSALKSDLSQELNKVFIKNELSFDVYCLVTNLTIPGDFLDELNAVFSKFIDENHHLQNLKFRVISYRNLETIIDKHIYIKYRYSNILNPSDLEYLLTQTLKRGTQKTSDIWFSIFKKNSERFIYTSIQDKAIEVVKSKNIILFSGPPKSGKTFNAQALIFNLCCIEEFSPLYIVDLNTFEDLYEGDSKQIFLFDDAFGKNNLDKSRSDILERKLEQIFETIDAKHLCVFTSREHVYRSFEKFTDKDISKYIKKITVQVTELSLTEKESLFERYYKSSLKMPFNLPDWQINKYINHTKFSPETIRSFFDNTEYFDHEEFMKHLEFPDQYLATVFTSLSQEKQQTLLAILFGLNGQIKNISYTFKNLLNDQGNTRLIHLQDQLSIMEDSIVSCLNEQYTFYHPSMAEFFLRYLSREAGNYRSLAFKNLNLELLSFIKFSESKRAELFIKIDSSDLIEMSIGFKRILHNPNSEIQHLNSIFTWVGSEDIMMNLKLKDNEKYKKLKSNFIDDFTQEAERIFKNIDCIDFDYFMRNLKMLYSQNTLGKIFSTQTIKRIIDLKIDNNSLWIVVFHLAQFIATKEELLTVVNRDWLNKFYLDLKSEINKLGLELFGANYPEFPEVKKYKQLVEANKLKEAQNVKKNSYTDYKLKTQRTWYPKYLQAKRKMNALNNSKPHGYRIYIKLEELFTPLRRLEENQRNRYYFLLEKGIWKN